MKNADTAVVIIEGIKLLVKGLEAVNAGDEEEALEYLAKVAERSTRARTRWENSKKRDIFE